MCGKKSREEELEEIREAAENLAGHVYNLVDWMRREADDLWASAEELEKGVEGEVNLNAVDYWAERIMFTCYGLIEALNILHDQAERLDEKASNIILGRMGDGGEEHG